MVTGVLRNGMRRISAIVLATATLANIPAVAQPRTGEPVKIVTTEAGRISVENLADGLDHPWGMVFLPDGRLLVTERAGNLRILGTDGELSDLVEGVPEVFAEGQGGLLDVALDPDFETNRLVYLSYAAPGPAAGTAATAIGRGRWAGNRIEDFEVLFRQDPWINGEAHFGGRIVFSPDGYLFLTTGERFQFEPAQDLSNHLGKIIRLNPDGSIPEDNPFADQANAEDEIWTYGHRNIQAAIIHPETGDFWIAEMGPRGGDELNRIVPGNNYGWPLVSWGIHYDGEAIPDPPTRPEFTDAVRHWTPVISPSGMTYYDGDVFPEWTGSVLIGGLTAQGIVRLVLDGRTVAHEERIPLGARIREVETGPDGLIYVLTDEDNGNVWRLRPLE